MRARGCLDLFLDDFERNDFDIARQDLRCSFGQRVIHLFLVACRDDLVR